MAGLDSFLNFFIPAIIVIFFIFIIYKGVKPQADAAGRWIAKTFKNMVQSRQDNYYGDTIVYDNF